MKCLRSCSHVEDRCRMKSPMKQENNRRFLKCKDSKTGIISKLFFHLDAGSHLEYENKGDSQSCWQNRNRNSPILKSDKSGFLISLQKKFEITGRYERSMLLHYVAKTTSVKGVTLLLNHGVDINARTLKTKRTPLHYAVRFSSLEVVKCLVARGADINAVDHRADPILFYAISSCELDKIQYLLDQNVDLVKHHIRDRILHYAVRSTGPSIKTIKFLIDKGFNIQSTDFNGAAVLHYAATQIDYQLMVRFLILRGSDIHAVDSHGLTPLHYSVQSGFSPRIIECLLLHGADVNARSKKGATPLHFAVLNSAPLPAIQLLLDSGADLDAVDHHGMNALHYAVKPPSNSKLIEFLLQKGMDINPLDHFGVSPLHYAFQISSDSVEMATVKYFLMCAGADPNAGSSWSGSSVLHTAFHSARANRWRNLARTRHLFRMLVRNGADVNAVDDTGSTVLHYVAAELPESLPFTQTLIENGAKLDVEDKKGRQPSQMVKPKIRHQVQRYLRLTSMGLMLNFNTMRWHQT